MSKRTIVLAFLVGMIWGGSAFAVSCQCRIVLEEHRTTNPSDYRALSISSVVDRSESFTDNIPWSRSCRRHCREAFGVGGSQSSNATAAEARLRERAEEVGKPCNWCGGWLSARLDSKKGRLGWRHGITGELVGIGGARVCSGTPPGLASSCCCGPTSVMVFKNFPNYEWSLSPRGHFLRFWWNQGGHSEVVDNPNVLDPLVSASLKRDPFGHGVVALSSKGLLVRTVENNGQWSTQHLMRGVLDEAGGVVPCGLITTLEGRVRGIWVVTERRIFRFFMEDGAWKQGSVDIGNHGTRIDPGSLYGISEGRIAGALKNGQRWNIWFANGDPNQLRFNYSGSRRVAPAPTRTCSQRTSC